MILEYAKQLYPNLSDKEAVFAYVAKKDAELDTETTERVNGTQNKTGAGLKYVGYTMLREFFDGDQWDYVPESGKTVEVMNFCRMTVKNYSAFLTQEQPEIDIPPKDVMDDIEIARVVEQEKILNEIFKDNKFYDKFYDGVQNGSILGDTIFVGPFWDDVKKRIWFTNVKRPEFIRILFSDSEYTDIIGYVYHYEQSLEKIWQQHGTELQGLGYGNIEAFGHQGTFTETNITTNGRTVKQKMGTIREFWDENVRTLEVAGIPLKYEEHNYGFIPIMYVKNMPHPTNNYGVSDIEDLIEPQKNYNEMSSEMRDIIKQVAYATLFGKNLDVEEIKSGQTRIYDLGADSEVFPDPRNTNYPFLQTYLQDKKQDVDISSGIPDVFQGGKGVKDVTGRALSVLMTPINNSVRGKEKRWTTGLQTLVRNIFILLEKKVPGANLLIQGHYDCDVFFPGTLVRDINDEINKFAQKLQSQYTTMKNIGIASPKDEQILMKKELKDKAIMAEISRNPQMQLQFLMEAMQMEQQANQRGQVQRSNSAGARLSEGDNQPGDSPMSSPGVPVGTAISPEQAASQVAGVPNIR